MFNLCGSGQEQLLCDHFNAWCPLKGHRYLKKPSARVNSVYVQKQPFADVFSK